ncbi:MAG: GAF domain-containing protein [Chloroflexi bacterium]|nr:GAF domain-containing protein [Chloroflexota bacterium]
MKAILVGERATLNQRLTHLLGKHGFEVKEAISMEEVMELLAQEPVDLMLLVAPKEETLSADAIAACRDVQPSLHVFILAADGTVAELMPKVQPLFGRKVGVNDLPNVLREAISREDVEREQFRLEWLRYCEQMVGLVRTAASVREGAQKVVEFLQTTFQCRGCAVLLTPEPNQPLTTIATAGDSGPVTKACTGSETVYQWLTENQMPLLVRRGRSTIPGIQRDIVKYGLGPCAFIPIITSQRMMGALAMEREPGGDSYSDSAFSLMHTAAQALALRMEAESGTPSGELSEMLRQEREAKQSLEGAVAEGQSVLLRLARELAGIIEFRKGHRPEQSETVAKLTAIVAEQTSVKADYLLEAVYLRDVGMLAAPDLALPGASQTSLSHETTAAAHARSSFEILSRVRLPSVCLEVARHHHENYDGSGAPDGLKGEDIPVLARVVRVVEDYVNMTFSSNGGQPVSSPVALGNLARLSGKLYDPGIVEAFTRIIRAQGVTPEQETLSLIAHELRTPLTFLLGFSELLAARKDLPAQAKEMASELHKQTEQMVTLAERLLELSRLQAGRVSLTWGWVGLKDVIAEQVNRAKALTDRHTFRVESPPYAVRIRADVTRVAQALGNLLSNAVKYSPQGGEIVVKVEETPKEVVLSVSDQGLGIAKEKAERLFQPFYRVQQAETRQIEGLGLGLALTRAIIEAHGGRIWVASEPGKGSTFSFSLPKQEVGLGRDATVGQAGR